MLSDPRKSKTILHAKVGVVTPASSVGESKVAIKNAPVLSKMQVTRMGAAGASPGPRTVTVAVFAV